MRLNIRTDGAKKKILISLIVVFLLAVPFLQGGLMQVVFGDEDEESYYEKEIDLGSDPVEQYLIGDDLGQKFGYCIKSGDLNRDGLDDVIVGSPGYNQSKGGIFIYYGGGKERSLGGRDVDVLIDSFLPGNKLGMDIAVGDVDGDGLLDILAGGWANEDTFTGGSMAAVPEVYLFLGSSGWSPFMTTLNADVTFQAEDKDHILGWNLELGDMNQDGMDEIIISDFHRGFDPFYFRDYHEGKVYIWDGSLAFDERYRVGEDEYDHVIYNSEMHWHDGVGWNGVGITDVNVGDVNNDGFIDVLIGSAYLWRDSENSGQVDIVFGGTIIKESMDLMVLPRVSIQGYEDYMLSKVECADVNGDGLNDLIVTAPNCFHDRTGGIFIFYGENQMSFGRYYLIDADFIIRGAYSGFDLGVTMIGDLDGDGRDDLLLSSSYGHSGGKGTYYIFYSSTIADVEDRGESTYYLRMEQPLGTITGPSSGLDFGASYFENTIVCNLDGVGDLEMIFGNPMGSGEEKPSKAGIAYILYPIISTLRIESFELKELEGQENNIIGAGKVCHFEGYIIDTWDVSDIEMINFGFQFSEDLKDYSVDYAWDKISKDFTESGDFNDYVELSTFSVMGDGNYGMKVYMNVTFSPTLFSEAPINVSFDVHGGKSMESHFFGGGMIKVEADLEFSGTLRVIGSLNGELTKGSFVQPGEHLELTGLKVVYQGTEISPPDGYFSVLMIDSYGTIFLNQTNSGQEILFRTMTRQLSGVETFTFSIIDLEGTAEDMSGSPYIFVSVDTDFPEAPDQLEVKADSDIDPLMGYDDDPQVWVTWFPSYDDSSNVIGYLYNTHDGGGTSDGFLVEKNWFVYDGLEEGWNTIYVWAIDEALNYGPASAVSVYYDVDVPIFGLPNPTPGSWVNAKNVNYEIYLYDLDGSGVKGKTVEYAISYDGGRTYSAWEPTNIRRDSEQLKVRLFLNFREGENNYVKWRAKDVAGNGYVISDPFQVQVDTQPLTYKEPLPAEAIDGNYVALGITLEDGKGSGVDAATIEYSISFNGVSNYGPWERMDVTGSFASQYVETPMIFFERDTFNYIRWRAKDVAGNGYTYSEDISIIVLPEPRNHDPVPIISNPIAYNYYLESTFIVLDGSKSIDTDGDDLAYLWYSDKDGYLGTEDVVKVKLSQNNHKISLHVNDGVSDVSISVDIYVVTDTTVVDTDGDGIPDLIDEDDDNDGLLDLEEDTNRNNLYDGNETDYKNWDTDGDGVSDKLDASPLDPDVWDVDDRTTLPFAVMLVVILGIIMVLVVIGVIIGMKQKTDRERFTARRNLRRNRRNIKRFEVLTGVPTNDLPAVEAVQWALPSVISQASEFVVETPPSDDLLPSPDETKDEVQPPQEEKPDLQDMEVPLPADEVPQQDVPEPPMPEPDMPVPTPPLDVGTSVTCSLCGSEFSMVAGQTSGECPLCGEMVNL